MIRRTMSHLLQFALIGGHRCLDFVNTEGGAGKARDVERLLTFDDAIEWATVAGVVSAGEERALRGLAKAHPMQAADGRQGLCAFRNAIYKVFEGDAVNGDANKDAVLIVEATIKMAFAAAKLDPAKSSSWAWTLPIEAVGLDVIRLRIALSMSSLMTSNDRFNVRSCEACSWLFLDGSPTRRRRWCSMAACGNRAKARRHYHDHSARR